MNEPKKRFVDQLLAADRPSADARQHYEKEMRAMFEKTLTRDERRGYLFGAVLMGLVALACGLEALYGWLYHREDSTLLIIAYFLLTAMALLVVAGIIFRACWKGILSRRMSNNWAAGAGVAYVGLLGCLSLLVGQSLPEMLRDVVRVFGLVLLVYAAVAWMRHRVAQAELRTAEKLLEIELRLAEVAEALEDRPKPTEPASTQQPPPE
ncbi:MAG TPA: hypothetical protein VJM82_06120 [Nitrospiraceae bacterium]|nr:hypothetical protein [Nitrospiraceae bacterium]